MHHAISDEALDQLFRSARSQNKWLPTPVSPTLLHALYDLLRMGPTSANCSPARFVFVTTEAGRQRMKPHLSPGNVAVEPGVVAARLAEQQVERGGIERPAPFLAAHAARTSVTSGT